MGRQMVDPNARRELLEMETAVVQGDYFEELRGKEGAALEVAEAAARARRDGHITDINERRRALGLAPAHI